MLSFQSPTTNRYCDGIGRRTFLQVGSLPFFGLSLSQALAAPKSSGGDDLSCILLWCGGGISTVDTFDMKPHAPVEYRGEFQPIANSVPGLTVCEHLPKVARQMHHVGQVRTIVHSGSQDAEANHFMLTA